MTAPHTAESLAAMPGVELSRIVAVEVMGWLACEWPHNYGREWYNAGTLMRCIRDEKDWVELMFRPDIDERHAAEVRRKCVEQWPGYQWDMKINSDLALVWFVHRKHKLGDGRGWQDIRPAAEENRAICIVAILASQALGGGK